MERRRAVAIAAATAATTMGAVAAIATNLGLLGSGTAASSPLGKLDAGTVAQVVEAPGSPSAPSDLIVRYEDIYVPAPVESTPPGVVGAVPSTSEVTSTDPGASQPGDPAGYEPGPGDDHPSGEAEAHDGEDHDSDHEPEGHGEEDDD